MATLGTTTINGNLLVGGALGVATTTPTSTYGGIDIASGGFSLIVGADASASTRTNTTDKYGRIGMYHYTNIEEPMCMLTAGCAAASNVLYIGGGAASMNAATYLLFYTAANTTTLTGTERMRVDPSGYLLLADNLNRQVGVTSHRLQIAGTGADTSSLSISRFSADASPSYLTLGKSRGAAQGTYTVVNDDDILGRIDFAGADGTDLITRGASIFARVNGAPGANDLPTELVFGTTADGAADITERMTLNSVGHLLLGTSDDDGTPATGMFVVKGTTNDGSTNLIVGRDSDEANVFTVDTNGGITATTINNLSLSANNTDYNTLVGYEAGLNLVSGATSNSFFGYRAGKGGVITDAADGNTAIGTNSLISLTSGEKNTCVGAQSGRGIDAEGGCVSIGYNSMYTTGSRAGYNVAIGDSTMYIGGLHYNVAVGYAALYNSNVNTQFSTGIGAYSLYNNGYGTNTALGYQTGYTATSATNSVYIGAYAGKYTTTSYVFFVDSIDRTNTAGELAKSLLYGVMNATASSQTLTTNSLFTATYGIIAQGSTNNGTTNAYIGKDSDGAEIFTVNTNGLLTVPAIKITTGAGVSKVLTSDADGDATWEVAGGITLQQSIFGNQSFN